MTNINNRNSKAFKIFLVFALVFILSFFSKIKLRPETQKKLFPTNFEYTNSCTRNHPQHLFLSQSTCEKNFKSFSKTNFFTSTSAFSPNFFLNTTILCTKTKHPRDIVSVKHFNTCPIPVNNWQNNQNSSSSDNTESNSSYELPEHRQFYLQVREHVICLIVYILVEIFWFSLFRKVQKNSQATHDIFRQSPNILKSKYLSYGNFLNLSNSHYNSDLLSTDIPENTALSVKFTLPTINITQNIDSFNSHSENTFPRKIRRRSSVGNAFFYQQLSKNLTSSNFLKDELEINRKILIDDSWDFSFNSNQINSNNNFDTKSVLSKTDKLDNNFVFSKPYHQFYITKKLKSQPILVKKSFKSKESIIKRSSILKPNTLSLLNVAFDNTNNRNGKSTSLLNNSLQNILLQTENSNLGFSKLLNEHSSNFGLPFWFRAIPCFAASIGMTLVSVQIFLLTLTIIMTNIMERSHIYSFNSAGSAINNSILNNNVSTNSFNSSNIHEAAKISFKNWFLPSALASYNLEFSNKLINNTIIGYDLLFNHDKSNICNITKSDYPGVLERFWQYQNTLTLLVLGFFLPLIWLILKYQRYRYAHDLGLKSQDSYESLASAKRQRDFHGDQNNNKHFKYNYSFGLKLFEINWKYVCVGMLTWYVFLFLLYQTLIGLQGVAIGIIEAYYMDFKKFSPTQLPASIDITQNTTQSSNFNSGSIPYTNSSILQNLFKFTMSLKNNILTLQQIHSIIIAVVLPLVLASSPLGVLNQIRFLAYIFLTSKSQIKLVIETKNSLEKILKRLNESQNFYNQTTETFEALKNNTDKLPYNSKTDFDFTESTQCSPNSKLHKLDKIKKVSFLQLNENINNGIRSVKESPNSKTNAQENIDYVSPIKPEFQFKLQNNQEILNEKEEIKRAVIFKLEECKASKIYKNVGLRKSFFWANPSLRYIAFLFFSALCLLFWLMLVLQSVNGLLNALYLNDSELLGSCSMLKNSNISDRNSTIHSNNLKGDTVILNSNIEMPLKGSILISIYNIVVFIHLFILTICGIYKPNFQQKSKINFINTNHFSLLKNTGTDLETLNYYLKSKIIQISNVEWESLYLLKILTYKKNSLYYSFEGKRIISQVFILLLIISTWPTMLRTINIISKPAYSLTIPPLAKFLHSISVLTPNNEAYAAEFLSKNNNDFVSVDYKSKLTNTHNNISNIFDKSRISSIHKDDSTSYINLGLKQLSHASIFLHRNFCYSFYYTLQTKHYLEKSNPKNLSINGISTIFWAAICEPIPLSSNTFYNFQQEILKNNQTHDSLVDFNDWYHCNDYQIVGDLQLVNYNFPVSDNILQTEEKDFNFRNIKKILFEESDSLKVKNIVNSITQAFLKTVDPVKNNNTWKSRVYHKFQRLFMRTYKLLKDIIRLQLKLLIRLFTHITELKTDNKKSKSLLKDTPGLQKSNSNMGKIYTVNTESNGYKKYQLEILNYDSLPLIYAPNFWLNMQINRKKNTKEKFLTRESLELLDKWLHYLSGIEKFSNNAWKFAVFSGLKKSDSNLTQQTIFCQLHSLVIANLESALHSETRNQETKSAMTYSNVLEYIAHQVFIKISTSIVFVTLVISALFITKNRTIVLELLKSFKNFTGLAVVNVLLKKMIYRTVSFIFSFAAIFLIIKYFITSEFLESKSSPILVTLLNIPSNILDSIIYMATYFRMLKNFLVIPESSNFNQHLSSNFLSQFNSKLESNFKSNKILKEPTNSQNYKYATDISILEVENAWSIGICIKNKIHGLLFADDAIILAESADKLQKSSDVLTEWYKWWDMNVNNKKSGIMSINCSTDTIFKIQNHRIPSVNIYKYFGIDFNNESSNKIFFKAKKKYFQKYMGCYSILKRNDMPTKFKVMAIKAIIQAVATYGQRLFGMSATRCKPLQQVVDAATRTLAKCGKPAAMVRLRQELSLVDLNIKTAVARTRAFGKWSGLKTLISDLIKCPYKNQCDTWVSGCTRCIKKYNGNINAIKNTIVTLNNRIQKNHKWIAETKSGTSRNSRRYAKSGFIGKRYIEECPFYRNIAPETIEHMLLECSQ
ncbi:hypothetical protein BB561_000801 [Smittium simulii]|uniref:Uncharacterized protein n=1 Tax=Smittium simulii TaxID=133385 RepID=A0A2T9YXH0_9FUNG|nr:hypothetical protein BB561_000801 [Smittium simulii]